MDKHNAQITLEQFFATCADCGACLMACDWLDSLDFSPGAIAEQVISGQPEPAVRAAIQRCALCGLCAQVCPSDLSPAAMFAAAREVLMMRGQLAAADYDVMLVDRDWHFFSIYRNTYGIQYDDLQRDTYDTLFFPGCTLSSYAPELTRRAYDWLVTQGGEVGFTDMCCGKPLSSIGLEERQRYLLDGLRQQIMDAGASRVVTACANCFHALAGQLGEIEVVSLYDLLADAGQQVSGPEVLTIHDSCMDRARAQARHNVRRLLGGFPLVEMAHHGADTICCGSGGIVSMVDPALCHQRAQERKTEFEDTQADLCVTSCMSCAHRLARTDPVPIRHVLELVFDTPVDKAQIQANARAMWEGEWGAYNLFCLSQAQIITGYQEVVDVSHQ